MTLSACPVEVTKLRSRRTTHTFGVLRSTEVRVRITTSEDSWFQRSVTQQKSYVSRVQRGSRRLFEILRTDHGVCFIASHFMLCGYLQTQYPRSWPSASGTLSVLI